MRIKTFSTFLYESTDELFEIISKDSDFMTFIFSLIHDKSHVMSNKEPHPMMETIFSLAGEERSLPLYRGLHVAINAIPGETITFNRYESFSENFDIAKIFAKKGIILKAVESREGFKYWEHMLQYDEIDEDDYMKESLEEEKEWIFNIGSKFRVKEIYEQDGYKIIEGTLNC